MTDQEINVTIAELCGWTHPEPPTVTGFMCPPGLKLEKLPPSYCTDLNAMHEAELWLARNRPELENTYDRMLRRVVQGVISEDGVAVGGNALPEGQFYIALLRRAPARQRAKAFLRTVGKWRDA